MKKIVFYFLLFLYLTSCNSDKKDKTEIAISVSFSETVSSENLDGRMLLMLSTNNEKEPRFQIGEGLNNQLIFGQNVDGLKAGQNVIFDETVFGFPISSLKDLKPSEYYIQAFSLYAYCLFIVLFCFFHNHHNHTLGLFDI